MRTSFAAHLAVVRRPTAASPAPCALADDAVTACGCRSGATLTDGLARGEPVRCRIRRTSNLHIAIWVGDLKHLYRFLTQDLGSLGVEGAETVVVGHAVNRPGKKGPGGRVG
jgi:hypothetical protein